MPAAMPSAINAAFALPEMFLAVAAMALLMLGVFRGEGSARTICWLSIAAFVVAAVLVLVQGDDRALAFGGLFVVDEFAQFTKLLILIGSMLAILMAMDFNVREGIDRFEYPVVVVLATLGMMMMVSANDLMSLYIGLELQSLSLYILAAFRRDTVRSTEAGLKYFILGSLSSAMLLYG